MLSCYWLGQEQSSCGRRWRGDRTDLREFPNCKNFGFSLSLFSSPPRSFHNLMGFLYGYVSWDFIPIFLLYSSNYFELFFFFFESYSFIKHEDGPLLCLAEESRFHFSSLSPFWCHQSWLWRWRKGKEGFHGILLLAAWVNHHIWDTI